jgi:hypothetical protein
MYTTLAAEAAKIELDCDRPRRSRPVPAANVPTYGTSIGAREVDLSRSLVGDRDRPVARTGRKEGLRIEGSLGMMVPVAKIFA